MSRTPEDPRPWEQLAKRQTVAQNPTVDVAARQDKVPYGPAGDVILRIVDRPIGFNAEKVRR